MYFTIKKTIIQWLTPRESCPSLFTCAQGGSFFSGATTQGYATTEDDVTVRTAPKLKRKIWRKEVSEFYMESSVLFFQTSLFYSTLCFCPRPHFLFHKYEMGINEVHKMSLSCTMSVCHKSSFHCSYLLSVLLLLVQWHQLNLTDIKNTKRALRSNHIGFPLGHTVKHNDISDSS